MHVLTQAGAFRTQIPDWEIKLFPLFSKSRARTGSAVSFLSADSGRQGD